MSANLPEQPLWTDEDPVDAADLLRLDLAAVLACLDELGAAASVTLIRQHLAELLGALADPASQLHQPVAAPLEVGRNYLIGELHQIGAAHTLERARYYVARLHKSLTMVRTSAINDLNLNRWKEYDDILTDSLWVETRRDRSGGHTAGYWGNFIPQIPSQMMRRYTKPGEWVLDTFAGSGTTMLEGLRLGRNTLGVELQPGVAATTCARIAAAANPHAVAGQVVVGDSRTADWGALLDAHGARSAQLVLMHPPYHDIIKFSDDQRDLSNAASVEEFLEMLGQIAANVAPLLDRGRYLALVIGDKYAGGEWLPLGFWAMGAIQERGFTLKSIVVKNFEDTTGKRSQKELWRYRALVGGFYIFKHEYIFVLQKR
ncbi:MAG: DNA methyltransferase [Herpetosiphonaceae bacterium]|nr:DNA methyltransferase [Herpetosiphonaceae bacterium]